MTCYLPNTDFQIEGIYSRHLNLYDINNRPLKLKNTSNVYWAFEFMNGDIVTLTGLVDVATQLTQFITKEDGDSIFTAERAGNLEHYLIWQDPNNYIKQKPSIKTRLVRHGANKIQLGIT